MEMPAPGNATLTNPVKERMQAGEVALGLNVRIARSGDIARIARTTGHDFILSMCSIRCFRWNDDRCLTNSPSRISADIGRPGSRGEPSGEFS